MAYPKLSYRDISEMLLSLGESVNRPAMIYEIGGVVEAINKNVDAYDYFEMVSVGQLRKIVDALQRAHVAHWQNKRSAGGQNMLAQALTYSGDALRDAGG